MTCTVLLNCPFKAEIRAVDSQSDLRICYSYDYNNNSNNNNNNSNIYWFVLCKYQSMERNFNLSITLTSADLNCIPVMLYIPKGEQITRDGNIG